MRKSSFLRYLMHPSFIFRKEDPDEVLVQKYVKRIYSPDSFAIKPRFRKKLDGKQMKKIEIAVKRVYNPKI